MPSHTATRQPNASPVAQQILRFALFYLAIAAFFIIREVIQAPRTPLFGDTDDALRITQALDLLGGQNWFDTTQYRLGGDAGAIIHWSRFIDAPIALLILISRPFLGDGAIVFAAYAWPLILLGALLALSARLCTWLLGPDGALPGYILPALSLTLMVEFSPGRVDHHNAQAVLTLLIAFAAVASWRVRGFAIISGLATALTIAIGTETLPFVAMAILTFGLIHVFRPDHSGAVRGFGLALLAGLVVSMVTTMPNDLWFVGACDALSATYLVAAGGAGLALFLATLVPAPGGWIGRFAVTAALGLVVIAATVWLYPQCLGGPYAGLDPWLSENWLPRITEAMPIWQSFETQPGFTASVALPPLAGVLVMSVILWRERANRAEWLILFGFLLLAVLVMVIQMRGSRLAAILAVPAGAWVILAARAHYQNKGGVLPVLGLAGAWLLFAGLPVGLAINTLAPPQDQRIVGHADGTPTDRAACLMQDTYSDLAALPKSRVIAPNDLGPHILIYTPHEALGAPYHRNAASIRDTFTVFNGTEAEARAVFERRKADYIVICEGVPELDGLAGAAQDSIAVALRQGHLPDWLEEKSDPGARLRWFVPAPR